jgi:hypothetical protein
VLLCFALESGITRQKIQRANETDGRKVASVTIERMELEEDGSGGSEGKIEERENERENSYVWYCK